MKLIQRRRQPTLLGRTWPAIVGLVIAINLLLVARSVISRIPQGDIKVVKSSKGTSSSVKGSNGGASTGSSGSEAGTSAKLPPPPRSCRMERNAEYDGEIVLKDGKQNIKRSAEECCAACHKLPMCNAWVFCDGKSLDGCGWGHEFGECWMKHARDLNPIEPSGRRGPAVEWASGLSISDKEYEAAKRKVEAAAKAQADQLRALRNNASLPLVYFDVEIKGVPMGRIEMVLFTDIAPRAAENFRQLCTGEAGIVPEGREGAGLPYHFKGASFYRIIHQFIDQSGINTESVFGGSFKDDPGSLELKHDRKGLLSIAHLGPDTATAHFSIMIGPAPHLNGHHGIFGQVVDGFDVVDAVNALSIGKPDNTATAEDGAVIADSGQIRKGTLVPDLMLGLDENGNHIS